MILRELSFGFQSVISNWKNDNANNLTSETAAYSAGKMLCNNYIKPDDDYGTVPATRATRAAAIYSAIAI